MEDLDLKALSESPSEKVTLHLDVEGFQTLDTRRKEVIPERFSINSMGVFFDLVGNIRRPSEMNHLRKKIFLALPGRPTLISIT